MTTTADEARAETYMMRYAREQGVSLDTARVMYALCEADCRDREAVVEVCHVLSSLGLRTLLERIAQMEEAQIGDMSAVCDELLRYGRTGNYLRMMVEIRDAWKR